MGLTIHYELRLPGSIDRDRVDQLLAQLNERAKALPFEAVSEVVPLAEPIESRAAAFLRLMGEIISEPHPDVIIDPPVDLPEDPPGDVESGRGFLIDPGEGCEPATVAFLMRAADDQREWFWRCHCKTQYASNVSDEHFVKLHVSLITLLDHARDLGIDVTVHDEGDYWEHRDPVRLAVEVGRWNHLMARFAGNLADRLGDEHQLQAAIFERRDFEHLEMGE